MTSILYWEKTDFVPDEIGKIQIHHKPLSGILSITVGNNLNLIILIFLIKIFYWEKTDFVPDEIGKIYAVSDEKWFALEQTDTPSLVYMVKGQEKEEKYCSSSSCMISTEFFASLSI